MLAENNVDALMTGDMTGCSTEKGGLSSVLTGLPSRDGETCNSDSMFVTACIGPLLFGPRMGYVKFCCS